MNHLSLLIFLSVVLNFNSHCVSYENFYTNQRRKFKDSYRKVTKEQFKRGQQSKVKEFRIQVLESKESNELIGPKKSTGEATPELLQQLKEKIGEVGAESSDESGEDGSEEEWKYERSDEWSE